MAINAMLWNLGEQSIINTWLIGSSSYTVAVGVGGANSWGIGLGNGGVPSGNTATTTRSATNTGSPDIAEIGRTTQNSYGRVAIPRSGDGVSGSNPWPLATLSGSYSTTIATAATFTLTTAPNPAVASLWFVAKTTTFNANDCYFGADLSAQRTFANADVERVTPTYKQSS